MENIRIVEVGPRDGLQNEKKVVPTEVKLEFIRKLYSAGLRDIEVSSFVRADKVPQMADASELYKKVYLEFGEKLRAPCLVPNLRGLDNALLAGVKEVAIFTATSDTFNKANTNATVDESFDRLKLVTDKLSSSDVTVRGYLSTVFGCPYEGEISMDATLNSLQRLFDLNVSEVSLGDTTGVAHPYQVRKLMVELKKNFDLSKIAMHFHDTEALALSNILASYEDGIRVFDSSAAGLGGCPYALGATGNVATDDVVNMFTKMGIDTGINLEKLHEASSYILDFLKKESSSKFFNAYKGRRIMS